MNSGPHGPGLGLARQWPRPETRSTECRNKHKGREGADEDLETAGQEDRRYRAMAAIEANIQELVILLGDPNDAVSEEAGRALVRIVKWLWHLSPAPSCGRDRQFIESEQCSPSSTFVPETHWRHSWR